MLPGAKWTSENNTLARADKLVLVLAGFLVEETHGATVLVKPGAGAVKSVPLKLRRKGDGGGGAVVPKPVEAPAKANGVGYIDFGDDLDDDEELIDEDTLLDGDDLAKPIQQRNSPPPP